MKLSDVTTSSEDIPRIPSTLSPSIWRFRSLAKSQYFATQRTVKQGSEVDRSSIEQD